MTSRRARLLTPPMLAVALSAALFHIAPVWYAQSTTPAGWTFSGNLTVSPDFMQYRVWQRQSQREGPVVTNAFTTEPNQPHLIVAHDWLIGQVARATGVTPEFVSAYMGCLWAMLLAMLLYGLVAHFFPIAHQKWWVLGALVLGGGLGAHLKVLALAPGLNEIYLIRRLVVEPLDAWPMFEDYRSHYLIKTLVDTHFAFLWLVTLGAVTAVYAALRRFTAGRVALAMFLSAAITLLHVYEGVTLMAIAAGIAVCCRARRQNAREAAILLALVAATVLACYAVVMVMFRNSGLPMPPWRAVNILLATLLIAYPVAWGLIAFGLRDYWRQAGLAECVLVGWALGCTFVTLSGPFYPYPDRGTMTLPVPLLLIAGGIFFRWRPRVNWPAALVAIVLMGGTPVWFVTRTIVINRFHDDRPWAWTRPAHHAIIQSLAERATPRDILLAEQGDELWLAPDFPGRSYVGHFFLTLDYQRKNGELQAFLSGTGEDRRTFLERTGARFVFVNMSRQPQQFESIAGLHPIATGSAGWLFEFRPDSSRGS